MAASKPRPRSHPLRALVLILVITAGSVAIMFGTGHIAPRLGIDLAGGTSVTLTAKSHDPAAVNKSNMDVAVGIIQQRTNGMGVSEAEVQTQGSDNIVVNIPKGKDQQSAIAQIGTTAKLYFRPVLAYAPTDAQPLPAPSSPGVTAGDKKAPAPSTPTQGVVPAGLQGQFSKLNCSDANQRQNYQGDDPTKPAVACSQNPQDGTWYRFALGPVAVNGADVSAAKPFHDLQHGGAWQVHLAFTGAGSKAFASTTGKLATQMPPANQFAIVLDGQVVSHPSVQTSITGGEAVISGGFSEQDAKSLANVLSYGALPLDFVKSDVTTVSPQLGSEQLKAGLIAGAIGMLLVVAYSLVYYRGLGLVSVAGLAVSTALTYSIMSLLGPGIGFALNLPAVCGAIVAIGITADSFIVYFERIRDEIRGGATLAVAVRRGWPRARRTILVSDFVSILCAVVLYTVTVGKVQGFAFVLGLSTLIDLVVIFLFTKPLVTLLARAKFFSGGHRWSGLNPKQLGARPPVRGRRRPTTPATREEA